MNKNRIIPFGYSISSGEIQINPQEKDIVVDIFNRYINGESYNLIASWLTKTNTEYLKNKTNWNKNMIARILQNKNYIGNEKYPQIIDKCVYEKLNLSKKIYTHTENEDIRNIKSLLVCSECGTILKRRIKSSGGERWYCPNDVNHISSKLSDEIIIKETFELQKRMSENSMPLDNLKLELDDEKTAMKLSEIKVLMKSDEFDINELRKKIIELTTMRYSNIELTYDTYQGLENNSINLDSKYIPKIASKILVSNSKITELVLKSGKKIMI